MLEERFPIGSRHTGQLRAAVCTRSLKNQRVANARSWALFKLAMAVNLL